LPFLSNHRLNCPWIVCDSAFEVELDPLPVRLLDVPNGVAWLNEISWT
jgi:hypothetical protein